MLGPLHQNEHFFEGTHATPLKNEISTLPTKYFFSDSRDGFALFLGLWGACLAHLTTHNTYFSVCVCPKIRFFLRIAHIAHSLQFSTKAIFYLMVPKDLNGFLAFVHAAEPAN